MMKEHQKGQMWAGKTEETNTLHRPLRPAAHPHFMWSPGQTPFAAFSSLSLPSGLVHRPYHAKSLRTPFGTSSGFVSLLDVGPLPPCQASLSPMPCSPIGLHGRPFHALLSRTSASAAGSYALPLAHGLFPLVALGPGPMVPWRWLPQHLMYRCGLRVCPLGVVGNADWSVF